MSRLYSQTVIDHAMNPRNVGDIQATDGYASVTGPCRDTMGIWLNVRNDAIVKARVTAAGLLCEDRAVWKKCCGLN